MDRTEFRKTFKSVGPAILPVIHVQDAAQTLRNVALALEEGVPGVFLINHDFPHTELLAVIRAVRGRFPALWLGVNFLGVTGEEAFPVLGRLADEDVAVDAYWADDACIDEHAATQVRAQAIDAARAASGWRGLYFGGTAFKKQREVSPRDYAEAAAIAARHMDAVTTSGVATGQAADLAKLDAFRRGCGEQALALASGVTPDNVQRYAPVVDAILVATGINFAGDFYNIDAQRLRTLALRARHAAVNGAPPDAAVPGDAGGNDR